MTFGDITGTSKAEAMYPPLSNRPPTDRIPNCPYLFHRDGRQVGDFRKVAFRSDFVHLSEPKGIRHRLALRV
jgi:hypothetical protein